MAYSTEKWSAHILFVLNKMEVCGEAEGGDEAIEDEDEKNMTKL